MHQSENKHTPISSSGLSEHHTKRKSEQYIIEPDVLSNLHYTISEDTSDPEILRAELEELTKTKERLILHADRMEKYLKEQLRKNRTTRLIHWGAELEHQLHTYAPNQKTGIGQITQDRQKKFMQRLFDDDDIRQRILRVLSDIL